MNSIHWLGTGMSSIPGIRRLASKDLNLTVWNRTLEKAQKSINHVNKPKVNAKKFDLIELQDSISKGDIIVSQLPSNMHLEIAKFCLKNNCHFISSSYVSQEIKNLDVEAKKLGLVFLNEIGLDPGIDHFFSHLLVDKLKSRNLENVSLSYNSYCGGIPFTPNDFKYKFSWSPAGVIRALNSESKFIENYKEMISVPYKNIKKYFINNEAFEAYPNRDSIPYIKEYCFPEDWMVQDFVRGTLRLKGWSEAWKDIFDMLDDKPENLDEKINIISNKLWKENKYEESENDRVVLWVSLEARKNNKKVWKGAYYLDEQGSGENTAMAKLVSITLSAAIDLVLDNKLPAGVQAATSDKNFINYIFKVLENYSIKINFQ